MATALPSYVCEELRPQVYRCHDSERVHWLAERLILLPKLPQVLHYFSARFWLRVAFQKVCPGPLEFEPQPILEFLHGSPFRIETSQLKTMSATMGYNSQLMEVVVRPGLVNLPSSAFQHCKSLRHVLFDPIFVWEGETVKFLCTLDSIGACAFKECPMLKTAVLPYPLSHIGEDIFLKCKRLTRVNLFDTLITRVPSKAFADCTSLLFASLPPSLEYIGPLAFGNCFQLVSVQIFDFLGLGIELSSGCFGGCSALSNIVLPEGSIAAEDSFTACHTLHRMFGHDASSIVAGLTNRYWRKPVHQYCYNNMPPSDEARIFTILEDPHVELIEENSRLSPFHVLFSMHTPRLDALCRLVSRCGRRAHIIDGKDINNGLALEYLCTDWSVVTTKKVLYETLRECILAPVDQWGARKWYKQLEGPLNVIKDMKEWTKVSIEKNENRQKDLVEHYKRRAINLFQRMEAIERICVLDLAVCKMGRKETPSRAWKRIRLEHNGSGFSVLAPFVLKFLGYRSWEKYVSVERAYLLCLTMRRPARGYKLRLSDEHVLNQRILGFLGFKRAVFGVIEILDDADDPPILLRDPRRDNPLVNHDLDDSHSTSSNERWW